MTTHTETGRGNADKTSFPINLRESGARRVIGLQALLTIGVGTVYFVAGGIAQAHAALYGGTIALISVWMLGRRVRLATEVARTSPGKEMMVLYIGAVQRFAVVLALFLIGMGWLKLSPVPLLVAFGVAQGAFFLAKGLRQGAAG